jgi:hypothetical protein
VSDVNVLVVFYSRYGAAEKLALAAGVGAIQARGNIRLRRVADLADAAAIASDAAWRAQLARMTMDYVAPRPADPSWADVIVLATPAASADEVAGYLATLPSLAPMAGRIAAPLCPGDDPATLRDLQAAAAAAGLTVASAPTAEGDALTRARLFGQHATQLARAHKSGNSPR